ncbi:MAG: HEAT repeat domain-containing protein [Myxococcaceae bacterium]|nr:HEAT repeat domain-containing protein [Myxococcaceae bacterium]
MGMKDRAAALAHLTQAFQAGLHAQQEKPFVPRHLEQAIGRLARAMAEAADDGITFTVSAHGLQTEDGPLATPPLSEQLAAPLLREGVKTIAFRHGLKTEEALPFAAAWIRTARGPLGTEGFATRVWDQDEPHVVLTLHPPMSVLDDKHQREGEARFRTWTSAPTIAGFEVVDLSDARLVPLLQALDATDLVPETGRVDDTWKAGLEVLQRGLQAPRDKAVEHLADALVHTGDLAKTQQEVNALAGVVDRLVRSLGQEHRFAEAVDAFKHAAHESHAAAGQAVAERFKTSLTSPLVMAWLIESLNDAEAAPDALNGLRHMGLGAARSLLTAPSLGVEGKRRLNGLIAELDGGGLAAPATQPDPGLDAVPKLPVKDAVGVLKKGLMNPDAAVRRHALELVKQEHAVLLADALHHRIKDPNAQVRLLAIHHVAELEDPSALPALVAQLHRSLGDEERKALHDALSRIGGPKAAEVLLEELHRVPAALKVGVVHALARVDTPKVRAALEAEADRLLAPPALKAACRDALTKLKGGAR